MKLICWIKTLIRTLSSPWFYEGVYIDGHDWIEQEDGTLICEICNKRSLT